MSTGPTNFPTRDAPYITPETLEDARTVGMARISPCGRYRYELHRFWTTAVNKRYCMFVMLNPSTADATTDDATIRRCIGYAKSWGYDGLTVGNLYGYRATNPAELSSVDDPIGPENDQRLLILASYAHIIVCAWGTNANKDRAAAVLALLREHQPNRLRALRVNGAGVPLHPLYLPAALQPQELRS